jgi:hypothetical protein
MSQALGGQNHICIRCKYGIFGREITIHTVMYGVYIRFRPTLHKRGGLRPPLRCCNDKSSDLHSNFHRHTHTLSWRRPCVTTPPLAKVTRAQSIHCAATTELLYPTITSLSTFKFIKQLCCKVAVTLPLLSQQRHVTLL